MGNRAAGRGAIRCVPLGSGRNPARSVPALTRAGRSSATLVLAATSPWPRRPRALQAPRRQAELVHDNRPAAQRVEQRLAAGPEGVQERLARGQPCQPPARLRVDLARHEGAVRAGEPVEGAPALRQDLPQLRVVPLAPALLVRAVRKIASANSM